jgi:sigma-B regulation protein RsbU (phosphoserine phosphatase)
LLRADGVIERLPTTATVIGAFEKWQCSPEQVRLDPNDVLAIFSDGITEAMHGEEEFGEGRFVEALNDCRALDAERIVATILARVQEFSAGQQSDDLTLLVARGRA